jgi:hypothetical protein
MFPLTGKNFQIPWSLEKKNIHFYDLENLGKNQLPASYN